MNTIPNLVTVDIDASRDGAAPSNPDVADGLLAALDRAKAKATFFMSRPVAEKESALARHLTERGHEVACLTTERPAQARPYCAKFTGELEATRDALEQATGTRVRGHRNAAFAVN